MSKKLEKKSLSVALAASLLVIWGSNGLASAEETAADGSAADEAASEKPATEEDASAGKVPDEYELTGIVVKADRSYGNTVQSRQAAGWLGNRDALDTPFHATTFTSESLQTMSVPGRAATDVLTLDPAIRTTPDPLGETPLIIRGIRGSGLSGWSINGIPGMTNQNEMPNNWVDSVTVVAGPSFGLTGTSSKESAGGLVNYISKKATKTPTADVALTWGPSNYRNVALDIGRRMEKDDRWGIRVNALAGNGKLSLANSRLTNSDIYINIDQHTHHSKTNLLLGYNKYKEKGGGDTIDLTYAKDARHLPRVPRGSFDLEPPWAETSAENYVVTLNHEQKFNRYITGFINAGYHREKMTEWLHSWNGEKYYVDADGNFINGYNTAGSYPVAHTTEYLAVGFKGYADLGKDFQNEYLLSFDKNWFTRQQVIGGPNADHPEMTGSIYAPNTSVFDQPYVDMRPYVKTKFKMQVSGIHFLDTITTLDGKLDILWGFTYNRLNQHICYVGAGAASHIRQSHTAPIYGLNYQITPELSAYYSHDESLGWGGSINTNYANFGEAQEPLETKSDEIGFKMKTGKMLHSISLFRMDRDSYISEYRSDSIKPYQVPGGKTRYEGIEISTAGSLSKKWDLMAGLDFLKVTQRKGADPANDGRRFGGVPSFAANVMAVYHPDTRWSLMGRVNYMGSTEIRKGSSLGYPALDVPSYTTVDVGANYTFKWDKKQDVTLSLMCYNLLNRHYWAAEEKQLQGGSFDTAQVARGLPRTVMFSANFKM